jgi:hypothetical protein
MKKELFLDSLFFFISLIIIIICIFNFFTKKKVVEGIRAQSYFGKGISNFGLGGYPITTGGFYGGNGFKDNNEFYYPFTYAYPPPVLYDSYGNPILLTTV